MIPKIVFVGFLHGYGGAERSMINVANGLVNMGNDVTIISLKSNNVVYEIDKKINYIFIPDTKSIKINKQLSRLLNLKKQLKTIKPDVVISFWLQSAIFTAIISKFIRFKNIYSERGDPTDEEYRGLLGLLRNIFSKSIDGFVFQSAGAKACFPEAIQKKSIIIHNAVIVGSIDHPSPNKRRKVIVGVGRLHEQKNHKLLINSFAKVSAFFPEYTLEIYGEGPLKNRLLAQIERLGLKNKVVLKGATRLLHDEIKDASLFVLTSDYEGMPNALLEAMALGLPCISTDCKPGGVREIIEHGINGIIVNRNSTEELACAIQDLINNPDKAETLSRNAKEGSSLYSPQKIYDLWDDYIESVIEGTG